MSSADSLHVYLTHLAWWRFAIAFDHTTNQPADASIRSESLRIPLESKTKLHLYRGMSVFINLNKT